MGVYGVDKCGLLTSGFPGAAWAAEKPALNSASAPFLVKSNGLGLPRAVSIELMFLNKTTGAPADPGAFEVDVQVAYTDLDGNYDTLQTINSGLNDSFVTSVPLTAFSARFIRLFMTTLTNDVLVTANIYEA